MAGTRINLAVDYGADAKIMQNFSIDLTNSLVELEILPAINTPSQDRLVYAASSGISDAMINKTLVTPSPLNFIIETVITDDILTRRLGVGTFFYRIFSTAAGSGYKEELSRGRFTYKD
jgi:hypothetical protein